jgi:GR25 family glycosyltransferase involved in LPS biosynthesis
VNGQSPRARAFIIHLERAAGRKAKVERLQSELSIESEIIAAVDGAQLAPVERDRAYVRSRFRPRYPFALVAAEIGAFLSHRAAWKRIVGERLDFAAIFEDDAEIDPRLFADWISFLTSVREAWDYVLLPNARSALTGTPIVRRDNLTLARPLSPPLRVIGQIVSRAAAERLLRVSEPFDRPVDTFLQMTWVTETPVLIATPSPVRDVSRETGGTTVQRKSMGLFDRLHHEAMRPIYRAQVLARYRRDMAERDASAAAQGAAKSSR